MDLLISNKEGENNYGVYLFEDANPEMNPSVNQMLSEYLDSGLPSYQMTEAAGLSLTKKVSFWFCFENPCHYPKVISLYDHICEELSKEGVD